MKLLIYLFILSAAQVSLAKQAKFNTNDEQSLKIKSFRVSEISEEEVLKKPGLLDSFYPQSYARDCSDPNRDIIEPKNVSFDEVVRVGKEIWKVIEENNAVVEAEPITVSVLPGGIDCWDQLALWQKPKSKYYEVSYENYYGMEVINVVYRVSYAYAGSFNNIGKYLANITVAPASIEVSWGFKFTSSVKIPLALNIGTTVDPVAGLELSIQWRVKSLNVSQQSINLFVDGTGEISQL